MNNTLDRILKSIWSWVFLSLFILIAGYLWASLLKPVLNPDRVLEFTEKIQFSLPSQSKTVRIWIPVPGQDLNQNTEILNVDSPLPYLLTEDKDFGNQLLYFETESPYKNKEIKIKVRYKIARKERKMNGKEAGWPKEKKQGFFDA